MAISNTSQLIRSGLWRWIQGTGLERFELLRSDQAWLLRGTIVAMAEPGPAEASYEVVCDSAWRTSRADISLRDANGARTLHIAVEDGCWRVNHEPKEELNGCVDIDLGWSPSTNTLPIRRLGLAIGHGSGPLTAAWVRFPELTLQTLPQQYHRLTETGYRYTSRGGAFQADISVDRDGLVLEYEGFWQRVSQTS